MKFIVLGLHYVLPAIFTFLSSINYHWDMTKFQLHSAFAQEDSFDFIVVGGGSAGAVVASRLSENPASRVLLLEAGGHPNPMTRIPGMTPFLISRPEHDWNYKTVPQKHASLASENQEQAWPRGKVLGGTSILNLLIYIRGSPYDYNHWAELTADKSWEYPNLLKYFKRSIDYQGYYSNNTEQYGGEKPGPIYIQPRQWTLLEDEFLQAGKELGFQTVDSNGPQVPGFSRINYNIKKGSRQDGYRTFLEPFLNRSNLKISTYSYAYKIHLDEHKRAIGVSYTRFGKQLFVRAKKEIIVSGGTIETPKLLMLSGIGPKKHLESLGIKTEVDLPVGDNLQDHFTIFLGPFLINQSLSFITERDIGLSTLTDYLVNQKGPFGGTSPTGGLAFFSTSTVIASGLDWPNIQLGMLANGNSDVSTRLNARTLNIKYETLKKYYGPIHGTDAFNIAILLVRPKSRGTIRLLRNDPDSMPLIDPNSLGNSEDLEAMLEALNTTLRLVEGTEAFQRLNAKLHTVPFPGCENEIFRSEAYWTCFIRRYSFSLYHPVGTAQMGRNISDLNAVVDSKLRVIGTRNLRVADASIMPTVVNGNTNTACVLIGEKAADMIREDWKL